MSRLGSILLLVGCSEEPPAPVFDGWLGSGPHFRAEGNLGGEALALEAGAVTCTLEWEAPDGQPEPDWAAGALTEIRLSGAVDDRVFELELKRHDFRRDALPVIVSVVPRDDGNPPASDEAWVEWEWHTADGQDLYEQSAIDGEVTLEQLSGEPDHTGLVLGDGDVGGFVSARWSPTEVLEVSFTAPCTDPLVELVEQ